MTSCLYKDCSDVSYTNSVNDENKQLLFYFLFILVWIKMLKVSQPLVTDVFCSRQPPLAYQAVPHAFQHLCEQKVSTTGGDRGSIIAQHTCWGLTDIILHDLYQYEYPCLLISLTVYSMTFS
jgi:hypothetical protein